jgi:hypothetical protein
MVRTVFVGLVGKEPDFDFMSANTITMWREVVARHRIASCVDLMRGKPYFLMGDGSERKGKSLFGLYLVGFDPIEWKHFTVFVHHTIDHCCSSLLPSSFFLALMSRCSLQALINLLDFGKYKDAASTRKAVAWATEEYHKLELKHAIAFICDNTNSNSGIGKVGGFVVQMSREHGIPMFRIPCTGIFFLTQFSSRDWLLMSPLLSPCAAHWLGRRTRTSDGQAPQNF